MNDISVSYLTTDDMATLTGKTADFWARLCHNKTLPAVKLGNDWRVEQTVFETFMRGGGQATARKRARTARQQRRAS